MLAASLAAVDEEQLRQAVADRRLESVTLEWKRELPDTSDKGKHEIAKDVSAFANSDGGDLVIGIAERDGQAESLVPISGESPDAAMRRLTQVIEALVEPRLQGVELKPVDVAGGYALVVRVPASFNGPHSIRVNNARRFVFRSGVTTTDMSYDQLRQAFDRTASLQQQAMQFRNERVKELANGTTPISLDIGPYCVVHVIALSGVAKRHALDIASLFQGDRWPSLMRRRFSVDASSRRMNVEGGLIHTPGAGSTSPRYTQVFRSGAIEAVYVGGATETMKNGKESAHFWTDLVVDHFRCGVDQSLKLLKDSGFSGPAVVSVAFLRAAGYALATGEMFRPLTASASSITSDKLVADGWVEQLESADVDATLGPLLDVLWQGFDRPRCEYFDAATGAYLPNGAR